MKIRTRDVAIDGGDLRVATAFTLDGKVDRFDWQTKRMQNAHVRIHTGKTLLGWLSDRLERRRVPVLRTDQVGTISVRTDGRTMWISSRRGRLTYPLARSE